MPFGHPPPRPTPMPGAVNPRAGRRPAGLAPAPLALLAGLALGLRLWQLGQPSLWHDEALELQRSLASLPTLLAGRPIDQDPPLAALVWRLWILAGGGPTAALATSEWWLRLP
ncbi:MAG: hypothetical protein KDH92_02205, partial [Chloroflexi bacterium]|nr:hypothetical protein [Chloroflexota bacterium]